MILAFPEKRNSLVLTIIILILCCYILYHFYLLFVLSRSIYNSSIIAS